MSSLEKQGVNILESARIKAELLQTAARLGQRAESMTVGQNLGKHAYEIGKVLSLRPHSGSRLLDVGGGAGVNVLHLARTAGFICTLIDRFDEYENGCSSMGDAATAIQAMHDAGVKVVRQDVLHTWPIEDSSIDVVTCFDVLEHLPKSPAQVMREAHRVLKRGGWLLVSGPNLARLSNRLRLLVGRSIHYPIETWCQEPYYGHVHEYTKSELLWVLRNFGFHNRGAEYISEPHHSAAKGRVYEERPLGFVECAALWCYVGLITLVPAWRSALYVWGQKA